jgi:hypothetical protein
MLNEADYDYDYEDEEDSNSSKTAAEEEEEEEQAEEDYAEEAAAEEERAAKAAEEQEEDDEATPADADATKPTKTETKVADDYEEEIEEEMPTSSKPDDAVKEKVLDEEDNSDTAPAIKQADEQEDSTATGTESAEPAKHDHTAITDVVESGSDGELMHISDDDDYENQMAMPLGLSITTLAMIAVVGVVAGGVFVYVKSKSRARSSNIASGTTAQTSYMPVRQETVGLSHGNGGNGNDAAKSWGTDEAEWEDVKTGKGHKW